METSCAVILLAHRLPSTLWKKIIFRRPNMRIDFRRYELPRERPLQDRLAEAGGALEVSVDDRFQLLQHAQAALHFGHDPILLSEGRERNRKSLQFCSVHVRLPNLLAYNLGNPCTAKHGIDKVKLTAVKVLPEPVAI